jgi:hypothetical protein
MCVSSALAALSTIKKRPHQRCPAAKLLSKDEARRIASNIAKLPDLLGPNACK